MSRRALGDRAARGRGLDPHARARHRGRGHPRPRACDLPRGGRPRRATCRAADGPLRPGAGDRGRLRRGRSGLRDHRARMRRRVRSPGRSRLCDRGLLLGDRPPLASSRCRHVPAGASRARDLLRPLGRALRCRARTARLPAALRRQGPRLGRPRRSLARGWGDHARRPRDRALRPPGPAEDRVRARRQPSPRRRSRSVAGRSSPGRASPRRSSPRSSALR